MAARLKVFRAEIGGAHEWIVAAPSQTAAAAIWGTDTDVFREGRGGPTTKPAYVEAAMRNPGTPLRRVIGGTGAFKPIPKGGDLETWKLAAKAAGATGKRPKTAKSPPPPKPKVPVKAKAPPKPKPDRSALDAAEAALKVFEAEAKAEAADIAAERKALAARETRAQKHRDERRAALKAAITAARKAYRTA
ncbi:hypothetical protein sos41_13200 [Alphaproteobacteria bacterium SO-S41]|nr:hypothetical protein sos41_13200 [Alphaproteobacteria bacterium SO-S41]